MASKTQPSGNCLVRQRLDEQIECGAQIVRKLFHPFAEAIIPGIVLPEAQVAVGEDSSWTRSEHQISVMGLSD